MQPATHFHSAWPCLRDRGTVVDASHLEPAHVEEELEEGEEREDEVSAMTSAGTLLEGLTTHQTGQEEQVHGHGDHLDTAIQANVTTGEQRYRCLVTVRIVINKDTRAATFIVTLMKLKQCRYYNTMSAGRLTTVNTKLSYRRRTARCAMLINSCHVSRAMEVVKVSNSKSDPQGLSRALAIMPCDRPHIRFPTIISLPLQLCIYLAPFPTHCHLFPEI